jgi:hypothetical protein
VSVVLLGSDVDTKATKETKSNERRPRLTTSIQNATVTVKMRKKNITRTRGIWLC